MKLGHHYVTHVIFLLCLIFDILQLTWITKTILFSISCLCYHTMQMPKATDKSLVGLLCISYANQKLLENRNRRGTGNNASSRYETITQLCITSNNNQYVVGHSLSDHLSVCLCFAILQCKTMGLCFWRGDQIHLGQVLGISTSTEGRFTSPQSPPSMGPFQAMNT